jgi:hypothetical protein
MADTNRRARDAGRTTVSTTATEDGGLYGFANRRRRSDDCVDSDIDGDWVTAVFTLLDGSPPSQPTPAVATDGPPAATAQHPRRPIDDRPSNQRGGIQ